MSNSFPSAVWKWFDQEFGTLWAIGALCGTLLLVLVLVCIAACCIKRICKCMFCCFLCEDCDCCCSSCSRSASDSPRRRATRHRKFTRIGKNNDDDGIGGDEEDPGL